MQIVQGIQYGAEHFVATFQVAQIGAGEMRAGIADAVGVGGTKVFLVCGIADFQDAATGVQEPRVSAWHIHSTCVFCWCSNAEMQSDRVWFLMALRTAFISSW